MIAVLDYNMGNLLSVTKALETAGATVRVVDNPAEAAEFNAVILPGVGNFGEGMENLRSSGMDQVVSANRAAIAIAQIQHHIHIRLAHFHTRGKSNSTTMCCLNAAEIHIRGSSR